MPGIKFSQPSALAILVFAILMSADLSSAANEIYRCTLNDGTVSFQELPCTDVEQEDQEPDAKTPSSDEDFFSFDNPFDSPPTEASDSMDTAQSADRAECEREARGKIDAIYASLEARPPKAKASELLAEAMQLTRQLRACKEL